MKRPRRVPSHAKWVPVIAVVMVVATAWPLAQAAGAGGDGRAASGAGSEGREPATTGAGGRWMLAWADEFEGPAGAPPDSSRWSPERGDGSDEYLPGWGNRERQYYTDLPENLALDGQGHLAITAQEVDDPGLRCYYGACQYTSARITTRGKAEVRFGRIEARIRLPRGQGLWAAFWMLGTSFDRIGWPACGEIDIMEHIGRDPGAVYGTAHGPGYSGARGIGGSFRRPGGEEFGGGFHVFTIEWEPGEIRWYVDETPYFTLSRDDIPPGTPWAFDSPFFLSLNLAVGGIWPGYPDASTTFPQTMLVDYVRVYQARDAERE